MTLEDLIRRTWHDEAFKQQFLNNPVAILKDVGVELADGIAVFAHEQTDDVIHLILQAGAEDEDTGFEDILRRALTDEAFKTEFINNPKAMIERETGVDLPEHIKIYVHEQTDSEVHLVLPLPPETS